jgi:diguanylate cyclase
MKIVRYVRSHADVAYALVAVFLGAVALAALESFVPDQALSALRSLIPGETPFLQLLLLGSIGVGLGRLTIKATPTPAESGGQAKAQRETADKDEKVDRVLRQVAKVLQTHLTDSESFSERLDGHNQRLSRHEPVGPIKEIVLALIEDNRDMRNRLDNVRNQLEESRLQVVQLQTNLERAEEAGLRDVVTAVGNRRFFDASFIEEVEKARRLGDPMCLALADIDRFKHVNDRFGHLVGDRLLRLFANILVQNVRGQDKVARFGGEEFALIFGVPAIRRPRSRWSSALGRR